MATDPLMERYTFDPYFEPEWCERCGHEGHNGLHCPEEDDLDELDDKREQSKLVHPSNYQPPRNGIDS